MKLNQEMEATLEVYRARVEVEAAALDDAEWERARPVRLARYWSGAEAPPERRAEARLIWTDDALGVRFFCRQAEPLIINGTPRLAEKTIGLWERDVCEIFIAPDAEKLERYFEFEVAPTGEWLDLAIRLTATGRETDWQFQSGMTAAARVEADAITLAMRIPWAAMRGETSQLAAPRAGARWRANLYRCVGQDPQRGYLAWQPTLTPQPNFHVPHRFGWLEFKSRG
jgi:hypothetical protein